MAAADYKAVVARKLTQAGISADIDPLWARWTLVTASDAECAERVYLAALDMEIAALMERFLARAIDATSFSALLDGYRLLRESALESLQAIGAVGAQSAGTITLGYSRRAGIVAPW